MTAISSGKILIGNESYILRVWAGPRGNACHNVQVKVNLSQGDQMSPANTAVVGVRPAANGRAEP